MLCALKLVILSEGVYALTKIHAILYLKLFYLLLYTVYVIKKFLNKQFYLENLFFDWEKSYDEP